MRISINETSYSLRFGMACIFQLSRNWGLDTFEDVIEKLSSLESKDGKTRFQEFEIVADLIFAAIVTEKSNDLSNIKVEDVLDWLLPNQNEIVKIVTAFNESITGGKSKLPANSKKLNPGEKKK